MTGEREPSAVPADYDDDPERFRLARSVQRRHGGVPDSTSAWRAASPTSIRASVLDVGCGEGELARHLADGAWLGVDSSREMLTRAPAPAVLADAAALPFPDGSFDAVALLYVLYHLQEPASALSEAHRVLRPGGLLAVAAPSRYWDASSAHVADGRRDRRLPRRQGHRADPSPRGRVDHCPPLTVTKRGALAFARKARAAGG